MGFVIRTLVTAVALWVAVALVGGIYLSSSHTAGDVLALIVVAAIIGLINSVLKPIIKVLGCPLYLLTLGLFALVVNALLLELAAWFAGLINVPFHVDGFWSAFWGAIIIGIVSWALNLLVVDKPRKS